MRILFINPGCDDALHRELRVLGYEVDAPEVCDWYRACTRLDTPASFQKKCLSYINNAKPDMIILHKGWHWWRDINQFWSLDAAFLEKLPDCKKAFVCWDDPCAAPVSLGFDLIRHFDFWLTSCPGITDIFDCQIPVHEFWQAWDEQTVVTPDDYYKVELAITGQPYSKPFPWPHYQSQHQSPLRVELASAAIEAGFHVGIWGPPEWKKTKVSAYYRGWLPRHKMHAVHASAKVVLGTRVVNGRRYANLRLFQVLGAGGAALLHSDCPDLHSEFEDAITWFESSSDMITQLHRLLGDEQMRQSKVRQGRVCVLQQHLWKHRAKKLIEIGV